MESEPHAPLIPHYTASVSVGIPVCLAKNCQFVCYQLSTLNYQLSTFLPLSNYYLAK
ncbi:MAG: hypothetical protein HC849_14640 [Oscillatoriales cyanobacterium RU_3_3]|nr:hypothetical protein [Oscillatoriales cyanobacterium RU_3_3]NJR25934.1 hypothetical protein [Richelia sp. CSU_2_1]